MEEEVDSVAVVSEEVTEDSVLEVVVDLAEDTEVSVPEVVDLAEDTEAP